VVGLLALVGCVGRTSRDVEWATPQTYTVQRGDTLYSIAFDAGQDYREVARWNGIRPPYVIKPGQQLTLTGPDASRSDQWTVKRGDSLYKISRQSGVSVSELARLNGLRSPYTLVPGQRLQLGEGKSSNTTATPRSSTPVARRNTPAPPAAKTNIRWHWPARGEVIASFDSRDSGKGINIAGKRGDAVLAAAPGTVVYEGSGLRGYGRLIIIKHDSDFLSAYAHCDRTYVQEGNVIKSAQKIADMGSTGTKRVMLHFEIRYRGVPVDPLKYLPKS